MDKMTMQTPDLTTRRIDQLAALFPSVVTERRDETGALKRGIDFEALKALLTGEIAEGEERYEFTWVGKRAAAAEAARPTTKTLRPVPEDSRDWDTTQNLYIEGDNLDVLKILQESYLGKVKMIYIDPPYNTGNDFIYRDDFSMTEAEYAEESGMIGEDGERMVQNTESNGRFHSDWCSMMYSRLLLARNLLANNGMIFISIDDCEVENIKKICNEIYGEINFVACIVWQKKTSPDARMDISTAHEYILIYAKDHIRNQRLFNSLPYDETRLSSYTNLDNDVRGPWASVDITGQTGRAPKSQFYEIVTPSGEKYFPPEGRCWAMSKQTFEALLADNRLWFGENGNNRPRLKKFLSESDGQRPWTWWDNKFASYNQAGNKELMRLFDGKLVFDNPKPTLLLSQIIRLATSKSGNDIVLDFFSGSASIAESVMSVNIEDQGNRNFICIQIDQPLSNQGNDFKANNIAAQLGYMNICEIGKERIRRAGDKIKAENPLTTAGLDTGFRVFRVDESNMQDVWYHPEELTQEMLAEAVSNIKPGRTDLDLLYACLLDWGVEIHLPHKSEIIDGCTIHNVDDGAMMACFDENVPESVIRTMAAEQPLRAVFRDSSFASDTDKINVTEIFKNLSPDTKVKVI